MAEFAPAHESPPCASWRALDILCPCPLMCPVAKSVLARSRDESSDLGATGATEGHVDTGGLETP